MNSPKNSRIAPRLAFEIALLAVAILWAIYFLDLMLPWNFNHLGIRPRELSGLWGVLFCPLLHANLWHLVANSGALFGMFLMGLLLNRGDFFEALLIIVLAGGGLVWLFGGGGAVHIGASGVVFGLIGYLVFSGWLNRRLKAALGSLLVLVLYGGVLLNLLVVLPGVSWSSHFFGFLSGVLAAWLTRPTPPKAS